MQKHLILTRIENVSFDARAKRLHGQVTLSDGERNVERHIDVAGHSRWTHQQIVAALRTKALSAKS